MEWEFVVALVIAIPIVLFPAAYVWYLNIGGMYAALKKIKARRTTPEKVVEEQVAINPFTRDK
jgi:hypothetical protein